MDANLFALVVKLVILNTIANAIALTGTFIILYCCNKIEKICYPTKFLESK